MKIGMMSFTHMHANSYANALTKMKDVQIVGVFDESEERGQQAAALFGASYFNNQEEFLSLDMDAVIVCSENNRHKEMVINAAKAKKHILCEKPIATNIEDAKEMIEVCKEQSVILQIAYPVRFSTPIRHLKELIDKGELGEIIAFRTTNRGQNPGGWFIEEEAAGGGAVLDHTVHMVDIMRWYLGQEVSEVSAIVDSYYHDIAIDDAGLLTLKFTNGVIASHDPSWSRFSQYPTWGDATIEVIGTKQIVKVDAFKEHFRMFVSGEKSIEHVFYGNDMDFGLVQDFVQCVKEGREPSVTGYDGLKSLEVALAAYESSKLKQPIKL